MSSVATRCRHLSCLLGLVILPLSGCSLLDDFKGVPAVPAHRVPLELLAKPRLEMQEISMVRLRQDPPQTYLLGPQDVLGIYVENMVGKADEPPPVHFPEDESRPPAFGYPISVRDDGTIDLPLIPPIHVSGKTLSQTSEDIRKAYTTDHKILPEGMDRVIVTLMRRRMHRILVVREESGGQQGVLKRGTGHTVNLPAYENDLLHALNETGGMPGLDADNEILIYHGMFNDGVQRDELLAQINAGRDPCQVKVEGLDDPNVVRIPLRFHPHKQPRFTQNEIILRTGDIVVVKARDREKFYTGGALPGGEHLLPRDYDLDILGAIALVGGPIGNSGIGLTQIGGSRRGLGGAGSGSGIAPSRAIVLRNVPGGGQVPIRIDLNKAISDPSQRILIQPGDMIIVRYTLPEELYNAALSLVQFNFLFSGFGGGL